MLKHIKVKNENTEKKNTLSFNINKVKVNEESDSVVRFSKPLPITSDTEQLNGTKYDIKSMDISGYGGLVTVNHSDDIQDIVGKVIGLNRSNKKITIEGIEFAIKENALARFAKDMLLGKFVTDFSIETIGPWPTDEGVYENSKLVGLSMVIVGNNVMATVNELAIKAINSAKDDGIDASKVEDYLGIDNNSGVLDTKDMKYKTVKNTRDFEVSVSYKNAAEEDVEKTLKPGESVDVSEDQADAVGKQVTDAEEVKEDPKEKDKKDKKEDGADNALVAQLAAVMEKLDKLEKTAFDKSVNEPGFKKVNTSIKTSELKSTNYRERAGQQINYAWEALKNNNQESAKKLNDINEYHVEELKKAGKVNNVVTIADFGNFVISPELLKDIEGHRSNFQALLSKVEYKDTLSLQMAYLKRNGDIDMSEVEMCDDGADGNLKPISEYTADIATSDLKELAAVTPVCNAATRFLAVDLISDVTQGYRTDFDRKKAQLLVARLQQAVNTTGYKNPYDRTTATTGLTSWIDVLSRVTEEVGDGGLFVMNYKTKNQLVKDAIEAGISGPLANLIYSGDLTPILGQPSVIVPNELLPTLNSGETKSFTVEGATVTIDQSVFYFETGTYSGRTSGGLSYDLSTEAAYEDSGVVKSAFQRNELVLRGSFFRGGAVRDDEKVSSMYAAGIS